MGRWAGSTRAIIVGAIEVTNFVVALVEMEMQIASAIRANQQSGEHILFSILTFALPGFATFFLNLLPGSPIDNRLMDIFEHNNIFRIVRQAFLVFVRLTVGLEINKITAVFPHCQDFDDRSGSPTRVSTRTMGLSSPIVFFNRKRDLQTLFEKTAAELGVRHKLIHPLPHGATAKWSAATVRIRNVFLATPSTLWTTLQSSSPFTIPDPTTYL